MHVLIWIQTIRPHDTVSWNMFLTNEIEKTQQKTKADLDGLPAPVFKYPMEMKGSVELPKTTH